MCVTKVCEGASTRALAEVVGAWAGAEDVGCRDALAASALVEDAEADERGIVCRGEDT